MLQKKKPAATGGRRRAAPASRGGKKPQSKKEPPAEVIPSERVTDEFVGHFVLSKIDGGAERVVVRPNPADEGGLLVTAYYPF